MTATAGDWRAPSTPDPQLLDIGARPADPGGSSQQFRRTRGRRATESRHARSSLASLADHLDLDESEILGGRGCERRSRELTYNQMVVNNAGVAPLSDDDVDRIFQALADATRRDIVRRTLVAESSVSELARDYAMSFAAVQKHVAVLERAGLVTKQARGRERIVCGNPEAIRQAQALLDQFEQLWRSRIDRLDALFSDDS